MDQYNYIDALCKCYSMRLAYTVHMYVDTHFCLPPANVIALQYNQDIVIADLCVVVEFGRAPHKKALWMKFRVCS